MNDGIDQGLAFLAHEQAASGGFLSYSSTHPDDFSQAKKYHSIFPSALILGCLAQIRRPATKKNQATVS